ncbi:MAG TPA: diguanylate cyclase, partial [Bacillota bacterium]|nr:diguanylate cyclase [Bacillota bacterium]
MKEWKTKRSEEISEHMLITHIVYFLIFCMAIISISGINFYNILSTNFSITYIIMISWVLFASGIILYTSKKLASGLKLGDRPTPWDLSLFLVAFLLSVTILTITGRSGSPVKILFLIPVVISSSSYGKIPGMITAGAAGAVLLYFDFAAGIKSSPSVTFQADLVNSGVMLTLAWLIGGLADIEKAVRENLTSLANTDELTGLPNHRRFQEVLRERLKHAKENRLPFSLIMFDIDHFKFYNDNFGHLKGDEVL